MSKKPAKEMFEIVQHSSGRYTLREIEPKTKKRAAKISRNPVHLGYAHCRVERDRGFLNLHVEWDVSYCNDRNEMIRAGEAVTADIHKRFPGLTVHHVN